MNNQAWRSRCVSSYPRLNALLFCLRPLSLFFSFFFILLFSPSFYWIVYSFILISTLTPCVFHISQWFTYVSIYLLHSNCLLLYMLHSNFAIFLRLFYFTFSFFYILIIFYFIFHVVYRDICPSVGMSFKIYFQIKFSISLSAIFYL